MLLLRHVLLATTRGRAPSSSPPAMRAASIATSSNGLGLRSLAHADFLARAPAPVAHLLVLPALRPFTHEKPGGRSCLPRDARPRSGRRARPASPRRSACRRAAPTRGSPFGAKPGRHRARRLAGDVPAGARRAPSPAAAVEVHSQPRPSQPPMLGAPARGSRASAARRGRRARAFKRAAYSALARARPVDERRRDQPTEARHRARAPFQALGVGHRRGLVVDARAGSGHELGRAARAARGRPRARCTSCPSDRSSSAVSSQRRAVARDAAASAATAAGAWTRAIRSARAGARRARLQERALGRRSAGAIGLRGGPSAIAS